MQCDIDSDTGFAWASANIDCSDPVGGPCGGPWALFIDLYKWNVNQSRWVHWSGNCINVTAKNCGEKYVWDEVQCFYTWTGTGEWKIEAELFEGSCDEPIDDGPVNSVTEFFYE